MTPEKSKHLYRRLQWEELDAAYIKQLIALAKEEDLEGAGISAAPMHTGDLSTELIHSRSSAKAELCAREDIVLCGIGIVQMILESYGQAAFETSARDGQEFTAGKTIGVIAGQPETILKSERIILNFIQKLSGVATNVKKHCHAMKTTDTKLLDTRKTTPGYRALEKYAVGCGGAWNHRLGLFDRIMLKDNHLAQDGIDSLSSAVKRAKQSYPDIIVEIEVDNPSQIERVIDTGADVILLDNFSMDELREAVAQIGQRACTEASGGVSIDSLPEMSGIGLDFISCGSMVHASKWVDIGLDWC